jgi:hypothetical protein
MRTSTLDHSRPGGKRKMQRFKLPGSPRRFLAAHAAVYNTFNIQRHLISRRTLRRFRANATEQWRLYDLEISRLSAKSARSASGVPYQKSARYRFHAIKSDNLSESGDASSVYCSRTRVRFKTMKSIAKRPSPLMPTSEIMKVAPAQRSSEMRCAASSGISMRSSA